MKSKNLFHLIRLFSVRFLAKALKHGARATIVFILENVFVPMKKTDRFEWEKFLLGNRYFPFRQLICDCWHTEIKHKYPLVGLWNVD